MLTNPLYYALQYDAVNQGEYGTGTFSNDVGFGWTNGVVLDLLSKYGDVIISEADSPSDNPPACSR